MCWFEKSEKINLQQPFLATGKSQYSLSRTAGSCEDASYSVSVRNQLSLHWNRGVKTKQDLQYGMQNLSLTLCLSSSQMEMWICFPVMSISFPVTEITDKSETILITLIFSVQPGQGTLISRSISLKSSQCLSP